MIAVGSAHGNDRAGAGACASPTVRPLQKRWTDTDHALADPHAEPIDPCVWVCSRQSGGASDLPALGSFGRTVPASSASAKECTAQAHVSAKRALACEEPDPWPNRRLGSFRQDSSRPHWLRSAKTPVCRLGSFCQDTGRCPLGSFGQDTGRFPLGSFCQDTGRSRWVRSAKTPAVPVGFVLPRQPVGSRWLRSAKTPGDARWVRSAKTPGDSRWVRSAKTAADPVGFVLPRQRPALVGFVLRRHRRFPLGSFCQDTRRSRWLRSANAGEVSFRSWVPALRAQAINPIKSAERGRPGHEVTRRIAVAHADVSGACSLHSFG